MPNLGCRLLLLSTLRLFVPLAVGAVIGALAFRLAGGLLGATVGVILGLLWSIRALLADSPASSAKKPPPRT